MGALVLADTDVLIDFLEIAGAHEEVAARIRARTIATSAVVAFELWRGCESDADRDDVRRLLRGIRVYPVDAVVAREAGTIWRELKASGIGERDTLIAAAARVLKLPILTANAKHFRRVRRLEVIPAR